MLELSGGDRNRVAKMCNAIFVGNKETRRQRKAKLHERIGRSRDDSDMV